MCINLVKEAQKSGARKSASCKVLGLSLRTLQRWERHPKQEDKRHGPKKTPPNSLTAQEKERMLMIANSAKYRDLNPHKIVVSLADEGEYIASESSFYRLFRQEKLLSHRSKNRPVKNKRPPCLIASKPNQVWSWDITFLPSSIKGQYFYLYVIEDVFSRMITGWCIEEAESSEIASKLMSESCAKQSIERNQVHLHSDNGSAMKGATMLATLERLGVSKSFSRPSVSNDNPFSESLFKTLKYVPNYPEKAFESLQTARKWVADFVKWYNEEHLHSEIRFVTPHNRHHGLEESILKKRDLLYKKSRNKNPLRWSKGTRNWSPIEKVVLNHGNKKTEGLNSLKN